MVKRLPTVRETQVQSLGREDLLEKGMATHSSIPAWKIPWMEESGRLYSPWGRKESDTTERLHFPFHFSPQDGFSSVRQESTSSSGPNFLTQGKTNCSLLSAEGAEEV